LPSDFEITLLYLTRNRERVTLEELAKHLDVSSKSLMDQIAILSQNDLVVLSNGVIELDAVKRMSLADYLIRNGYDAEKIFQSFIWQEFEDFAAHSLDESGYRTFKHLIFKSKAGRREIDLLAWNDNFILSIDCKHWARRLSPSRVRKATLLQTERTKLLAEHPEVLAKHGLQITEMRGILPVIVTLAESRQRIIDGVPVVPIMKLPSFLYGISPVDETLRMVPVETQVRQSKLV
jgi:Holliday junction resolvase-like predicted endonuclease